MSLSLADVHIWYKSATFICAALHETIVTSINRQRRCRMGLCSFFGLVSRTDIEAPVQLVSGVVVTGVASYPQIPRTKQDLRYLRYNARALAVVQMGFHLSGHRPRRLCDLGKRGIAMNSSSPLCTFEAGRSVLSSRPFAPQCNHWFLSDSANWQYRW